jgi:DNA-binding CsgD family transcriptional regulator
MLPPHSKALEIPEVAAALFEVGSAVTYEDFGEAAMRFLRSVFEFHGAEIHLHALRGESGGFAYTNLSFPQKYVHGLDALRVRSKLSPVSGYFAANPNVPVYRGLGVMLPQGPRLKELPFYRQFMVPEGWRDILGMAFWNDGFDSCFFANRSFEQPAFGDAEAGLFQEVQPIFAGVLKRVNLLHDERAKRANLEDSLLDLPIATLLLGWSFTIEQANRAANRMCVAWSEGAEASRVGKMRESIHLPDEILAACRELKEAWRVDRSLSLLQTRRTVPHPTNPGLHAAITLLRPHSVRLTTPSFLVRITEEVASPSLSAAQREGTLKRLTPAERELIPILLKGLTNKQIAEAAGKSLHTVKHQMSSILGKLGLPNRATLISLLRT